MGTEIEQHRGAKIGTRIAHVVSNAMVHTHNKLLDTKHKLAMLVFNSMSNEISDEVDMTIGPVLRKMAEAYEAGGPAEGMLAFMAHGRGQLKALAGSTVTAQSITWALGTIISNELAPDVYKAVGFTPNLFPDPGTVATVAAVGAISEGDAFAAIGGQGYSAKWAGAMIEASRNYPGVSDLLQLARYGAIDEGTYMRLAEKAGVPANIASVWFALKRSFVSMEDAAVAYLRGAIDRAELDALGQFAGFTSGDIDVYLEAIGEPPGTQDLLEGYRRGFIGQTDLERGIRQGRTRNEWIPLIEKLRFAPMSIADAVNAVVQNHLTAAEGQAIAEQNGLEPDSFPTLIETAGEPLSRTEMEQLYNRGLATEADVEQALRESRLKNKYVSLAFQLHTRLLEPRSLGEAVRRGALSHDEAIRKAMESGYSPQDAAVIVESASAAKLQASKDRVVASAEALFMDSAISEAEFRSVADSMGYDKAEENFLVQAAAYHREAKAFTAALNAVRSKYISHHIDQAEASALMDGLGVPSSQRDYLIGLWTVELAANTRELTPAQVVKAVSKSLITPEEGQARLEFLGYSAADATLLMNGA